MSIVFLMHAVFLYKYGPHNKQDNSFGELNSRAGDGGFFVWNWEETMALGARGNPRGGIQRVNLANNDQRNYMILATTAGISWGSVPIQSCL
jgi:hypothetical protein